MYSPNDTTKPISARMAPGLTERIDYECECSALRANFKWGARRWNRNQFLNCAAELLLLLRHDYRAGNMPPVSDWPSGLKSYAWMVTDGGKSL